MSISDEQYALLEWAIDGVYHKDGTVDEFSNWLSDLDNLEVFMNIQDYVCQRIAEFAGRPYCKNTDLPILSELGLAP